MKKNDIGVTIDKYFTSIYLDVLAKRAIKSCKKNKWKRDWKEGGCYLHLEVSELIESLRGKKGTPTEEFADVMFVLLAICKEHNIRFADGFSELEKKLSEQEVEYNEKL